jgi:cyclic 2,3-diphosphoglycerate synthetase
VTPSRVVVLVDGEHHPSVVRAAVDDLRSRDVDVVGAAMLGGGEKLATSDRPDLGVPAVTGRDPVDALRLAVEQFAPAVVVDLSDDPVVDARTRSLLAAHALARGIAYRGADFELAPPPRPTLCAKPSIAVIGTGKRTGKTALAQALARVLRDSDDPVIVTMARGGPAVPEVVDPQTSDLSVGGLIERAATGQHAASDHLEDAIATGVVAIGTRRCGGGVAGTPSFDDFAAGVALANERPEGLLILEGSGRAIPPVHADATVCVVPADADPELVTGHVGVVALLLSDVVLVTLAHEPDRVGLVPSQRATPSRARELESRVRAVVPGRPVVTCSLRPVPLEPLAARNVFLATTAPDAAMPAMARRLERDAGAKVVGWTTNLGNRERLRDDLVDLRGADVLVTEIKGAGVDTAARSAAERGMDVVFLRHDVDLHGETLETRARALAEIATRRFEAGDGQP